MTPESTNKFHPYPDNNDQVESKSKSSLYIDYNQGSKM